MRGAVIAALMLLACASTPQPCDPGIVATRAAAIVAECEALCAPTPVRACAALQSCLDRLDALEVSCRGK